MRKNEKAPEDRWQALDAIKTLGLLGALFGHIFIWWFGENWDGANSGFYSVNTVPLWLNTIVHFLLVSAGAAFYFYLKRELTFKKFFFRIVLFVFLGILFGLNFHPPALFWNIFLFYALSVLIIFILNRYNGKKIIFLLTLCVLFLTPLLRLFLNKIAPVNY